MLEVAADCRVGPGLGRALTMMLPVEPVYTLVVAEMTAPPTSDEQQQQQQRAPPTGSIIGVLAVVHGGKGEYSIVGNLRDSSRSVHERTGGW